MLVLTRRAGQAIRVGPNVEVRVVRIEGDRVVLGIAAPRHVAVVRSELVDEVSGEVREAADTRAKLRVMLKPMHALDGPAPETPSPDDPGVA
ncbi:MAG: carbon storage regulator [Candidatus Limnocylindrales bacterium]|jgi:carbon storage regulator